MKPAPPDFSFSFQKAVADWRKRHAIREDDVILLCLELFQIHQKHWDDLRHRDLPSFNEFRETTPIRPSWAKANCNSGLA